MKSLLYPFAFLASLWTKRKEKYISDNGRSLNMYEIQIAKRLKIQNVTKIKILSVARITHPLSGTFSFLKLLTRAVISEPIGLTLGYSILIQKSNSYKVELIAHELVHIKQYEEKGSHVHFLKEYISQCIKYGYNNCPIEIEAHNISQSFLKDKMV
ncbi:MAG: hypothetical protein V3V00_08585 [Saprospiraceae bacterium]